MKKNILIIILLLSSVFAKADKSGSCGEGLSYYFDEANSTLTISGIGSMNNYSHDPSSSEKSPWYSYRSKIEKVIIEPGVTTIGTSAFFHSVNIKTVIIPNSIERIYNYAFSNCSALESIDLPPNMSFIAQEAFCNCSSLRSVSIQSVEKIYIDAFKNCNNIQYVNIGSIEDWCKIWFQGIYSNPLTFAGHLFVNGVEVVDLVIPNSIKSIGNVAFYNCEGLTSVSIPEGVEVIEQSAFAGCQYLTKITIPHTVTTIWNNAFERCTGLNTIILGKNIELIREYCFQTCSSLKDFYCYAEDVPQTGNYIFLNTPYSNAVLHVPSGAIEKYKQREPWKYFKNIVAIAPQKYSLTYTIDGEEYQSLYVEEGEAITPIANPTKEGYTFSGWSEIPETMPANDVTVTGSFSVNKYNLTYKVDGVDYKTNQIEYGLAITPEAIPTKEGYTFSGWSEIPKTMPASDVTIIGTFTVNKYKLTYTLDGKEYKTAEVDYGTALTPEEAPVKEGYTFSGWSDIPESMPANDVTVTGTFTVNKYKLTYMVDGEEYKSSEVDFGTAITAEAIPVKEGYTFSGWSEIPSTMPASDVNITGTFTINKYKLTYMVDGEEYKSSDVDYGTAITAEAIPTKEGYTFSGWSEIPSTMPASDVNITGTFNINKYKLTYMVDGVEYKSSEVEFGSTITAENNPSKEGYTFSGWSEIPEAMPASDVTVTGTFVINKYKLTYLVDGKEYKSSEVEFGSTIAAEDNPTKEGYTFSGWSDIPETMQASDVTITGTFNINKYKLTYMVDGVEYKSYEVEFGATITPEASPANEGQTFSGWSEIPATMPANDVVITGTFSDNSYKLTYMVDGEVFKSSHVEYGSTITPETPPTKEGYTFSGWSEIPETMPAGDVTISGTFTPNKYKLTYTVDGVEYKTAEVDCGAAITPEDNPTKEGYTFSGWSEIPETMPASDVTVSGTFTINTYTITYMVDNALLTTEEVTYGSTITPPASPKEGYEITWNSHPTTMPAYDVTIYGSYISTGINGLYADEADNQVYTPDGKRIQSPKKGMNIIRMSDGTIKKVVVK